MKRWRCRVRSGRAFRLLAVFLLAVSAASLSLAAASTRAASQGSLAREEGHGSGAGVPDRLALAYRLYAGGLHVFSSESEVTLRSQGYDVRLGLWTDGWLAWLFSYALEAEAAGEAGPRGLAPRRFRTGSEWRGRERWVEITYDGDGTPLTEANPPPKQDDRDRVPEALRAGTVDPITAALGLLHSLQRNGRCEGEAAIFDGRRRFAASATHGGEAVAPVSDLAPFGGPAIACRLRVVPVVGFWKDPEHPPKTQDVTVYVRQLVPGWPPLPVRVEAETRYGAVRAHLVRAAPLPAAQRAAR